MEIIHALLKLLESPKAFDSVRTAVPLRETAGPKRLSIQWPADAARTLWHLQAVSGRYTLTRNLEVVRFVSEGFYVWSGPLREDLFLSTAR
jgi:hypothetical protein